MNINLFMDINFWLSCYGKFATVAISRQNSYVDFSIAMQTTNHFSYSVGIAKKKKCGNWSFCHEICRYSTWDHEHFFDFEFRSIHFQIFCEMIFICIVFAILNLRSIPQSLKFQCRGVAIDFEIIDAHSIAEQRKGQCKISLGRNFQHWPMYMQTYRFE